MEKTMVGNERLVGTEIMTKAVEEIARNMKKNHLAIWREVLRDLRNNCEMAEYGRFHG